MFDFSVYDCELVDIFVEEGKDLFDYCDGLISELCDVLQDCEVLVGLQCDLYILKGGVCMVGINVIGDFGYSIELLLEVVVVGCIEIECCDVQLLECGFDCLYQLFICIGNYCVVELVQDLVDVFEVCIIIDIVVVVVVVVVNVVSVVEVILVLVVSLVLLLFDVLLLVLLLVEGVVDEDLLVCLQQEQVCVCVDLFDCLVNYVGEVVIYCLCLEQQFGVF